MIKKITPLKGSVQKGKTPTLNTLIEIIEAAAGASVTVHPILQDRRIAILYKGEIIGVGTLGDTEYDVEMNFDFFNKNGYTIVFTACRIKGATIQAIHRRATKAGITPFFKDKILDMNPSTQSTTNSNDANWQIGRAHV